MNAGWFQKFFESNCVSPHQKNKHFICSFRSDDDDDREENLGLSEASVDGAGEGTGVCRTTPWTTWSPCSVTCGIGISMRTRTFVDHAGRKKCPHITIGNLAFAFGRILKKQ